ncbi:hypothetical protein AA313_de0208460 [Arthrobotrys entomopaga]|nr:hypothetical protein AA313_de0208460 [Arthrobotrys entomopaga]
MGNLGSTLNSMDQPLFKTCSSLFTNSGTRKGLFSTSSMPASFICLICSGRAFAVIATIGILLTNDPSASSFRISPAALRPSITGISTSMRITDRSYASLTAFIYNFDCITFSRASRPWFATCVSQPSF